jgi:hypothetical protein
MWWFSRRSYCKFKQADLHLSVPRLICRWRQTTTPDSSPRILRCGCFGTVRGDRTEYFVFDLAGLVFCPDVALMVSDGVEWVIVFK